VAVHRPAAWRKRAPGRGSAAKFLEVARLIESEDEGAFRSVAASLAVLAGIAAADAACCRALGRRCRPLDALIAEAAARQLTQERETRPHIMAAYERNHQEFADLYTKLSG